MTTSRDLEKELLERARSLLQDPNVLPLIRAVTVPKRSPDQEKVIHEFVVSARDDLRASQTLYNPGYYANSIFHLEQSVEKLTKAYALYFSMLNVDEVREVKHYTLGVFFKQLQRNWVPLFMKIAEKSAPQLDQGPYHKLPQIVKDFKGSDKKAELAKIPREGIEEILKFAKQVGDSINETISVLKNLPPYVAPVITQLADEFGRAQGYSLSTKDLERALDVLSNKASDFSALAEFSRLYVLCVITYPHSITTRYPGDYLAPSDYKKGLGIVDAIELLWDELEGRFEMIERLAD